MSDFKNILKKFSQSQEDIKEVASELIDKYPNSKKLAYMVGEINIALEALVTLEKALEEALTEAQTDSALLKDLLEQMEKEELYQSLDKEEHKKVAEYLVQTKQGLASSELLQAYVEKSLNQKPSSNLIAMYPKPTLIELGKEINQGLDDFEAYSAGLDFIKSEFDKDKTKATKDLAKMWFEKGPDSVIREFYAEALKGNT